MGATAPYYRPTDDSVHMPPYTQFTDAASYYATLLHELTHWTSHATRCDRALDKMRWATSNYAMEELIALSGQSAPPATLQ